MALINGKQILNDSIGIIKLKNDGAQGTITFGSGTMIGITDLPTNPSDLANKQYVDSLAAGLDPKESVRAASTTNIASLSGLIAIDGYTAQTGDRILIKAQTNEAQNGIYTASTGSWGRAEDSDGSPSNEVTLGNFTFVETGDTHGGQGWVLSSSNASNPDTQIVPGTDTQVWTQFSESTSFLAGNGIDITNQTISTDVDNDTIINSGGTGAQLEVVKVPNGLSAGTGLSFDSGSSFDGSVARTINLDNTGVVANTYGSASSIPVFEVNAQGQILGVTATSINITASQISDFATSAETAIFQSGNFVDSGRIDFTVTAGDSVTADLIDNSITERYLNTTNSATDNFLLSYDAASSGFTWVDVGAITTDTYATGGTYNNGTALITISDNQGGSFTIDMSSMDQNDTYVTGGTYDNGTGLITFTNNDNGTFTVDLNALDLNDTFITAATVSNGSLTLTNNDGGTVNGTGTIIQSVTPNSGLSASTTNGAVTIGVQADGINDTHIDWGTGATQVNAQDVPVIDNEGDFTGSTVEEVLHELQDNIEAINTATITTDATDKNVTSLATTGTSSGQTSGVQINATPLGYVQVFVNGALQNLTGDKVGDCYFSADGGTTARALTAIVATDTLYWNGYVAGFELETTDKITLIYET